MPGYAPGVVIKKSMSSVGIQADISDPEGVLGVIRSFQEQFRQLQTASSSLIDLQNNRKQSVQQASQLAASLDGSINELVHRADVMGTQLHDLRNELTSGDRELEDLINEKERLEVEAGEFHGQEVKLTNNDIDNEQRLTGFVEEELYRKMEELSFLHQRLNAASEEYEKQWNEFKNDMTQNKEEMNSYQETSDHVNELVLARYIGMRTQTDGETSDQDLIQRLVTHHWNQITHRQLQQQLNNSQVKEKDLENDIGALVNQKKTLWKRCLDLENCLEEFKDTTEDVKMLRPAPAYADLPQVMEGMWPHESRSYSHDLEAEAGGFHGLMLHRCHKHTNISIGESLEDKTQASTSTQVDTGAIDTDSGKIDSGKKQNESAPPAPPRDEPEEDRDPAPEDEPDRDVEHLQMKLADVVKNAAKQVISDADAVGHAPSFMSKLRSRVGMGSGGISSSSMKNKSGSKIFASGSTKRSDGGGKRGRR